ncbi:MAG: F0F1 ATP synthase subunit B [Spirochaetota bacterium]
MLDAFKEGLLKVEPGLLLWTVICFAILLLILWKAAWKPIIGALDDRALRIRKDLDAAEASRREAEELFRKHKEMIDYARDEAMQIVSEGRADAERVKNEIVEKAGSEAQAIVQRAYHEIELAKVKAIGEIKSEIVVLSTDIASKIIEKNLKPEDQKAIVEQALGKLN